MYYKAQNNNFDDIKKEDLNTNIIKSFNYGYGFNRAFKSGSNYKFNDLKWIQEDDVFGPLMKQYGLLGN